MAKKGIGKFEAIPAPKEKKTKKKFDHEEIVPEPEYLDYTTTYCKPKSIQYYEIDCNKIETIEDIAQILKALKLSDSADIVMEYNLWHLIKKED